MSPVTHFLIGWVVANSDRLNRKDRALVSLAGVIPDVDGLGIIAETLTQNSKHPLLWWSDYHHILAHNISFGVLVTAVSFGVATQRWKTALLVFLSFHLHLICDLVGARGPAPDRDQWPIAYLWPFSWKWQWIWSGQWELNAWPNFLITGIALGTTFYLAWKRGYSPVGICSLQADQAFVETLRKRFPFKNPQSEN